MAKIASDLAKPNGQRAVPAAEISSFLAPLPLARLWGVGKKTDATLRRLGLRTIGELGARDPEWLERHVQGGRSLWVLANGIDPRPVIPDRAAKTLGAENTFDEDQSVAALAPFIHAQALRVGRRLRRAKLRGRVVQLKVKASDFSVATRRLTLGRPTDDGQALYRAAMDLLTRAPVAARVRLTGVSVQGLSPADVAELFPPQATRAERLNVALDRIATRFGDRAVGTADLPDGAASAFTDLVNPTDPGFPARRDKSDRGRS